MKTTLAIALIAVMALLGCDDSGPQGVTGNRAVVQDNEEAALAALWLSGQLTAPDPLYRTIRDDLAAIRAAFADSTAMTAVGFRVPWAPSEVAALLTDAGMQRLRDGTFAEFYALGVRFGLARIDTLHSLWRNYGLVRLEFSGRQHPERLAEAYAALDDVDAAAPNRYGGDWSCVYPWHIDGGISYLVRDAWGDCPAGCIHNVFWYFRVIDDKIGFVGRYQQGDEDEPVWWDEANDAYNAYRGFGE